MLANRTKFDPWNRLGVEFDNPAAHSSRAEIDANKIAEFDGSVALDAVVELAIDCGLVWKDPHAVASSRPVRRHADVMTSLTTASPRTDPGGSR